MVGSVTPAQAAQQNNRDQGGRYAEKTGADPGQVDLPRVISVATWRGMVCKRPTEHLESRYDELEHLDPETGTDLFNEMEAIDDELCARADDEAETHDDTPALDPPWWANR